MTLLLDLADFWHAGGQPLGTSGTPIAPEMSAADKVTSVNSWYFPTSNKRDVLISSVQGYLSLEGVLTAMEDWISANPTPSIARTAIKELFRTLESTRLEVVEMSSPVTYTGVSNLLSAVVAVGVMTVDQRANLLAMAEPVTVFWWQKIRLSELTVDDAAEVGLV